MCLPRLPSSLPDPLARFDLDRTPSRWRMHVTPPRHEVNVHLAQLPVASRKWRNGRKTVTAATGVRKWEV